VFNYNLQRLLEDREIEIEGVRFFINLHLEYLKEVNDPGNYMPFNEMIEEEDCHVLYYDPVNRNIFHGTDLELWTRTDIIRVEVPVIRMPVFGYVIAGRREKDQRQSRGI
jgi:hypothetical protein